MIMTKILISKILTMSLTALQTFSKVDANRKTPVCYEDVRDVFVSRKESVFPMATYLDVGNNYIYNVRTPINSNQGANKSYVDQHVAKAGNTMYGILNMGNKKTINITGPTNDADAVNKAYIDTYFLNPSIW